MVPQYLKDCQLAVLWKLLIGLCLHLADELTTESVDDTGDGRLLALADEVEVKHALDGLGLHSAVDLLDLFFDCEFQAKLELCMLSASPGAKPTRRNILSWGGRACGRAEE